MSLGVPSDTYAYNIVDVNSTHYGTFDLRIDASQLNLGGAIPLVGNDIHIYNVTSGNKKGDAYLAPVLVLGSMSDGVDAHHVELKNCLAFNNGTDFKNGSGSSLFKNNSQIINNKPSAIVDMSNNVDIVGALPDGYLADFVKYVPLPNSPLVGKGVVIPETALDIYGKPRGSSYDIGAVQH